MRLTSPWSELGAKSGREFSLSLRFFFCGLSKAHTGAATIVFEEAHARGFQISTDWLLKSVALAVQIYTSTKLRLPKRATQLVKEARLTCTEISPSYS